MAETLKNFTASVRKPALITFGVFPTGTDLSWIETISFGVGAVPVKYVHPTTLTGTMDGANTAFVLTGVTSTPDITILVWNGVVLKDTTAFTITGGAITMQAGYVPESGDTLVAYTWTSV